MSFFEKKKISPEFLAVFKKLPPSQRFFLRLIGLFFFHRRAVISWVGWQAGGLAAVVFLDASHNPALSIVFLAASLYSAVVAVSVSERGVE